MLDAAYWLNEHVYPDEISGAFNAGIIAFFSKRQVINLDGVINNAGFEAIKENKLLDFMYRSSVSYYLDFDPVMWKRYSMFLGRAEKSVLMSEVQNFDRSDVEWNDCSIRVYQVFWVE